MVAGAFGWALNNVAIGHFSFLSKPSVLSTAAVC